MSSDGAGDPSREANRTPAPLSSCATRIQPKLAAGVFTHACTSAVIPAAANVALPELPLTRCDALTVLAKSPPGVVQFAVLKNRAFHVALPVVAGAPPPPPLEAT